MSFRSFIYYCALCGGWAAFITWAIQEFTQIQYISRAIVQATIIGGLLGLLLALVVGTLDALLNSVSIQRFIRVFICVVVGLLGSLLASFVGQSLFAGSGENPLFKVLGWTIVGIVIGVSIGVFDVLRAMSAGEGMGQAIRKIINGVIGGGIGGLIGGFVQVFFGAIPIPGTEGTLKDKVPRFALATGLVILGMCIGLLIGLAQVLLKEAWVRVEQGFRAGREMILSKPDTTVGRAESCDIGLFGDPNVEKMHARIVLKGDRYMLLDVNSPGGTFLNGQRISGPTPLSSGDMIGVGRSMLRFEERAKRR